MFDRPHRGVVCITHIIEFLSLITPLHSTSRPYSNLPPELHGMMPINKLIYATIRLISEAPYVRS